MGDLRFQRGCGRGGHLWLEVDGSLKSWWHWASPPPLPNPLVSPTFFAARPGPSLSAFKTHQKMSEIRNFLGAVERRGAPATPEQTCNQLTIRALCPDDTLSINAKNLSKNKQPPVRLNTPAPPTVRHFQGMVCSGQRRRERPH
jgi:hypothetical protein